MFKRPFWLGLLLGSLAALGAFLRRVPPAASHSTLLDLTSDAFVVCDAAGTIIYSNDAARQLFGPECAGLFTLCYSSGQRVPPGQLPHIRALRSEASVTGAKYHLAALGGRTRVLHATVSALSSGGTAAVFEDGTALHTAQARLDQAQARQTALDTLGRRLSAAPADAFGRVIVEETHALLGDLPDVQVRLYGYNPVAQVLTRLASGPEDRPKRPKSAADAQPPQFPFDAGVPELWQLYVARQPSFACLDSLGETEAASACALPLLAGGFAVGHLSLASSAADAFDDPDLVQTLRIAASAAALALSAPQAAELAGSWAAQLEAVGEITQALAGHASPEQLVDLVSAQVKQVTNAALCTVGLEEKGKLCAAGKAFQDDLLHPERSKSNDPVLLGKAAQKAWRTQKAVTHLGLENPSIETGPWRAFAGRVGQHSVLALPFAHRLGVLTVHWDGATVLPDMQIKFLQTAAALVTLGLEPAIAEEAGAG